jgi:hypothetical protein
MEIPGDQTRIPVFENNLQAVAVDDSTVSFDLATEAPILNENANILNNIKNKLPDPDFVLDQKRYSGKRRAKRIFIVSRHQLCLRGHQSGRYTN